MKEEQAATIMALSTIAALMLGVALADNPASALLILVFTSTPLFLVGFAGLAGAAFMPLWRKRRWWPQIASFAFIPVTMVAALFAGMICDRVIASVTILGTIAAKLAPPPPPLHEALWILATSLPDLAHALVKYASLPLVVVIAAITVCERGAARQRGDR